MQQMFKRFWKDELGASASEYALILAVVGPGVGAAALVMGANVKSSGTSFESELDATNAVSTSSGTKGSGTKGGPASTPGQTTPSPSPSPSPSPTPTLSPTPTPDPAPTSPPGNSGDKPCNPNARKCN